MYKISLFLFFIITPAICFSDEEERIDLLKDVKTSDIKIESLFPYKNNEAVEFETSSSCSWTDSMQDEETFEMTPTSDYFYFSIEKYAKPNSTPRLDFYKTPDFSGIPAFSLRKEGLFQNEKHVCSWKFKYSEEKLSKNFLSNCPVAKNLIGFVKVYIGRDSKTCSVLNISRYSINQSGIYRYQVTINNSQYFLDTRNLPEMNNGNSFLSNERRALILHEEKTKKKFEIVKFLIEMRESKGYQKLYQCYVNNDLKCLIDARSNDFLRDFITETKICNNSHGCGELVGLEKCNTSHNKIIVSHIVEYLRDFFVSVDSLEADRITIEPSSNKGEIYFEYHPKKKLDTTLHENMMFLYSKDKFQMISFSDGRSC